MAAKVVRDGNRVWLDPIDKFLPYQQNTVINCYATAMRAAGEDCSYSYLMGVSGAAFRFQLSRGQWCGSSPHAYCGYNCGKAAEGALPYETISYPCKADDANTIAAARAAVAASIDVGVPAIAGSEENSLIVGYVDGGSALLRRTVYGGDPNAPAPVWKAMPWGFAVLRPKAKAALPDRKQIIRDSLKQAVMIATADEFGGHEGGGVPYDAGIKAMQRWVVELRVDDAAFAKLDANSFNQRMNAWIYQGLCDARGAACEYLASIAEEFSGEQKAHVLTAAELYKQVCAALSEKCPTDVAPYPKPGLKWDAAARAVQAALLGKAIPIEQKAIEELKLAAGG